MLPRLCIVGLSGWRRGRGIGVVVPGGAVRGEVGEDTERGDAVPGTGGTAVVSTTSVDLGRRRPARLLVTDRRRLLSDADGRGALASSGVLYRTRSV